MAAVAARAPAPAPVVLSTFAGCGGSSLGYRLAGCDVRLAVEWDDNAVATYRANAPKTTQVFHGDIAELGVDVARELCGGHVDILDGSPPCQGFSTSGRRILDDPRNSLFREYTRLLRGLQPRAFVMENVSGMVKGKMRLVFVECLRELKDCGYAVSARVLNAYHYGVPQHRQRLIFIGFRLDIGIAPSHPRAMTRPPTLRDAWGVDAGLFELSGRNEDVRGEWRGSEAPSPTITRSGIGDARRDVVLYQMSVREDRATRPTQPAPTVSAIGCGTVRAGDVLMVGDATAALAYMPGPALSGRVLRLIAARWGDRPPDGLRRLTIGELRRLASFPDDFGFVGSWAQAWERIGNAVPPRFMAAIAGHVRALLDAPRPSTGSEAMRGMPDAGPTATAH